ncbi:hypothetical protein [Leeuwenhoekiella sp. H156]|uniref:hypothetical protein n=1 Tax=Leeuwenhoekiella sp. H156 TaxID=3450128 RepID=UPI003FA4B19A
MSEMILIYANPYGSVYELNKLPNPKHKYQLVIGAMGIFMSKKDLLTLLDTAKSHFTPCYCEYCQGRLPDKLYLPDVGSELCLLIDPLVLADLEELLEGVLFHIEIQETLKNNRIDT